MCRLRWGGGPFLFSERYVGTPELELAFLKAAATAPGALALIKAYVPQFDAYPLLMFADPAPLRVATMAGRRRRSRTVEAAAHRCHYRRRRQRRRNRCTC